jgi:hypothetical protein
MISPPNSNMAVYVIKRSTRKDKKYMAVFSDGRPTVHFGDNRYEQYRDSTPLKIYSYLDHNDEKRRTAYFSRHGKAERYSAKWFSHKFLW